MKEKPELFLKCLDENMQSCNGGKLQWKLNKKTRVKGKLVMCENGIHLTLQPKRWSGTRIFIAETNKITEFQEDGMKILCKEATLIQELTPLQLSAYEEGEAPLLKAYKEGKAPLLKAYAEGKAPLLKAYAEGKAPLLKAYEEGCQQILMKMLTCQT